MKLFVYGSLQHPQVWRQLIGRSCDGDSAVLHGWIALKVKNEAYPGLVPHPDGKVFGMIKKGLSASDLKILDQFEGLKYKRTQLVITDNQGKIQQAYVYLFKKCYRSQLSPTEWNYQEFRQQGLQHFLQHYCHLPIVKIHTLL